MQKPSVFSASTISWVIIPCVLGHSALNIEWSSWHRMQYSQSFFWAVGVLFLDPLGSLGPFDPLPRGSFCVSFFTFVLLTLAMLFWTPWAPLLAVRKAFAWKA